MSVPAVIEERAAWEKRADESAKAFHAFALYRDLGPHRSLSKVARALVESGSAYKTTDAAETMLSRWSPKYRWVDRAEAYDMEVDARMREAREATMEVATRRHAQAGVVLQGLAMRRVRGEADVPPLSPAELDASDVASMLRTGVQIERQAHGLPTEVVRGIVTVTATDHKAVVMQVVDVSLRFIPPEQHDRYLMELQRIARRGTGQT